MSAGVVFPSGTVTFLFTDIGGSTRLWDAFADVMGVALARHDEILRSAIEMHGGVVFATGGDGFAAVFGRSGDAVAAAIAAQRALQGEVWADGVVLRVRMGVHTGEAEERDGDYFGPPVNRAARLMSAAHGGQVVVSGTTVGVLGSVEGVRLVDLGSHRLKGVADEIRVFGVDADGLGWLDRRLVTEQATLGNLPRPVSEYVGRVDLLQDRAEGLSQQRLVTLTGTGGVGKTRTAVEVGWLVGDSFPDGVWLVELAAVTDETLVIPAIASSFGIRPQPAMSLLASVVEWLHARSLLLVLDNCEHVLGPVVELVSAITQRCESVTVLATSREPLGVAGEQVIPVPSLEAGSAVELFSDRAHAADASLEFGADDREVITEICERLDGIPLAIELAATRVRSMSPTQIRDRLDERFRLLTGSRRSIERHQTLRHTVQWSYDLLDPTEQHALRQVSVFAGGFTLPAATAISGDGVDEFEMLDVLDSLVAKSLLHIDRSDTDVRYGMLETIRQFAEEALAVAGDSDASRDRHADFFADHAEVNVEILWSEQEPLAYRWLHAEIANLSAAFRWSTDRGHLDPATRIATWAHPVASNCLRTETFGWAEEIVDLARASGHRQLPGLLASACDSAGVSGRMDKAVRYGLEAIDLNDDPHYEPSWWAYHHTGFALFFNGEVDKALSVWRVGAERPDDEPARGNLAFLHLFSAFSLVETSESERSAALTQIAASPVPAARAMGVWTQAVLAAQHDVAEAIVLYQQAIDMLVDCGGRSAEQTCRGFQTGLLAQTDDIGSALAGFTTLVNQWASTGGIYTDTGIGQLEE
jgi:predicted ATPase/class 3 adenylate cyclase